MVGGGNKKKDIEVGSKVIFGILTLVTGGATIAVEGIAAGGSFNAVMTYGGFVSSADDISSLFTQDGATLLEQGVYKVGLPKELVSISKIAFSFVGSKNDAISFLNKLSDTDRSTISIVSMINNSGQVYYGLFQLKDQKKTTDSNTKE